MNQTHDPAALSGLLAGLEAAINRALALAPAASRELGDLGNVVLAIECTAPEVTVFIRVAPQGTLQLMGYCEDKATTRVRGTLEDFIALAMSDDPAATLINSELEIVGNTAPLVAIQQIVTRMDVDWEAPLVEKLGDVAGHQLAEAMRATFAWGSNAVTSLRRQLSEYILEEGRLSPPKAELEHFFEQVQAVGHRVDRLQSRIERLKRRLDKAGV
ncbi:conserved hypothetical protein [Luminiphilus syltensis NOR5-1B]|uniref:Ubiquinone biosynthesis accessory factor UbiJ n=1 Tax=Luminiphilus syltensis NOR5-1B TaxID=565045 RepID=B8KUS3_9GAMM|nr:SCP2 sterol-binding domain-containing protein [Luminiphilus syltensis]EED34885.1 conserved hypothetical protein [Luminiphilus syltensis NOR5-1B]